MTKAKFPPKPLYLYGEWYQSRDEAIRKLGLTGYAELQTQINRYRKGLPFRQRTKKANATHEKLEAFKRIYDKHNIPYKKDE